jgi:hypothetical protein
MRIRLAGLAVLAGLLMAGPASAASNLPVYRIHLDTARIAQTDGSSYAGPDSHLSTISRDEMVANTCTNPGYKMEAKAFFLSDSISVPGVTTVSRLYNPKTGDHMFSIQANEISAAVHSGYVMEVADALFAYLAPQSGGTTVYRYYNPKNGDHMFTTSTGEVGAPYLSEGPVFYFSSSPTLPVDRLYNPGNGDHFFSRNMDEVDSVNCLNPRYHNDGATYLANSTSAGGDVPIFRLRNASTGRHLLTATDTERDAAITSGQYVSEGTAFYAYASATGGHSPVYRLRYNGGYVNDYLYTSNAAERDYALAHGYVSEGIAFYATLAP